jgi:CubicO group peptidase (beta-lactamase class C family)
LRPLRLHLSASIRPPRGVRAWILTGLAILALGACSSEPSEAQTPRADRVKSVSRGLDAALMGEAVASARELPRLRSLVVLRHGETLAEHRFNGGPALDQPVNIKSASKSVLSALIGAAIDRGVIAGADTPVVAILNREAPDNPDPRLGRVTLGHLLSMQAGLERTSGPHYGRWVSSPNWVRYALAQPFVDEPGGRMLYSTGSSHLLSAALTRASGRSTLELARKWLGEPLGIDIPSWPQDPQGIYFGGNDMLLSPRALAKFGELYRNGGRVDGNQIIPQEWIAESWRVRTTSPWSGNGYGYGWFVDEIGGYPVRFAWGYGGQMLYIVPDLHLTVVMTSDPAAPREGDHIGALHRLMSTGIIPAAEAGGSIRPGS